MKIVYASLLIVVVGIMLSAAISKILWPSCGIPFCFIDLPGLIRNVLVPMAEIGIVMGLCVPRLHRICPITPSRSFK